MLRAIDRAISLLSQLCFILSAAALFVIAAYGAADVAVAVAGGGDTVSAMNHAGVADDLSYVSTAGGAFLEWMEGKPLPGVEALRKA